MRILIKGYYGFGNFGDDILMLVSYRLTKRTFPEAEISICSESENYKYIFELLREVVPVIKNVTDDCFDLIIHGGGGVFFDFKEGGMKYRLLNKLIRSMGINFFNSAFKFYKKCKGDPYIKTKRRIGIGVGIGTYTPSSKKFYNDFQVLSDCDFLLVRDSESINNLQSYKFTYPITLSTDLAFHTEFWFPNALTVPVTNKKKIGLVLRDWPFDDSKYLNTVIPVIEQLNSIGYSITCFSFDKHTDQKYINLIREIKVSLVLWDPEKIKFIRFLEKLNEQSMLITSRAHGAIIGACLGIPSICLGIEPKLKNVAKMLKESSVLIEKPFHPQEILRNTENIFNHLEVFKKDTQKDYFTNNQIIKSSMGVLSNKLMV